MPAMPPGPPPLPCQPAAFPAPAPAAESRPAPLPAPCARPAPRVELVGCGLRRRRGGRRGARRDKASGSRECRDGGLAGQEEAEEISVFGDGFLGQFAEEGEGVGFVVGG